MNNFLKSIASIAATLYGGEEPKSRSRPQAIDPQGRAIQDQEGSQQTARQPQQTQQPQQPAIDKEDQALMEMIQKFNSRLGGP